MMHSCACRIEFAVIGNGALCFHDRHVHLVDDLAGKMRLVRVFLPEKKPNSQITFNKMKRSICTLALAATFSIAMAQTSEATDSCNDAVAVLLEDGTPVTLTGDNSAATSMGDFDPNSPVYGAEAVWHAFTTTVCMDVS